MRTAPLLLLTGLALATTAPAAVTFNVDGISADPIATPSAGAGGLAIGTVSHSPAGFNGENSGTITVTVTGLTIDANGTGDDSMTAQFLMTSAGGTINDNGTDWGVNGNGAGRISAATESLSISFLTGSTTLGAGATPGDIGTFVFKGFNQISFTQFDNPDGDIATLTIGAGSPANVTINPFDFTADPNDITVGYAQGGTNNDGFKLNHFRARFEVDVIPEPTGSLLALLGLTGLAFRRSRQ